MLQRSFLVAVLVLLSAPLSSAPLSAQKASQTGRVSQEIFETTVSMQYDRPVARGRELFGELVAWDAVWTPGANRATWIEFSTPVTLEGTELDAGRYALWMTPRESGEWGISIVSEWDTHHGIYPAHTEVASFTVPVEESSHMETLAFYFPVVDFYSATLVFHWGTTLLPLSIEVPGGG